MAGEKRTKDQEDSLLKEDVIIVDIEGTTTSINFVKETLFTYVRDNVKKYIDAKWEDQEFKHDLEKLKEQAKKDEEDKIEGLVSIAGTTDEDVKESLVKNILWQMDGDRKTGALKQLQGHMWREAYESGSIKGHVYEDVPECLKSWKNSGKKIYVYSSGSVEAQKMLFGHSEHGDLLEYFTGYFDTEVGMKQEAASYKNILDKIKAEATNVIFFTDILKEAKAAKEAGLSAIIMIREGNAPLSDEEKKEGFRTAKSFLELSFVNAAKRQKLDTPEVPKEKSAAETVAEKMEISEDVEMTDVSDKDSKSKVESNETNAEPDSNENRGTKVTNTATKVLETVLEKDEAMETDGKDEAVKKLDETVANTKPAEEKKEASKAEMKVESAKESPETTKEDSKSEETAKTVDEAKAGNKAEEIIEKSNVDETDKAVPADSKKTEVSEKPAELKEQKIESAKTELSATVDEAMEEATPTPDAKSVKVTNDKTETKTDEAEKVSEPTKAKVETESEKKEENQLSESCAKTVNADKSEVNSENLDGVSDNITKPNETSAKLEDAVPKSDEIAVSETVKENGTSKIETEIKAAENKDTGSADAKKTEPKVEETVVPESKDSVEKRSTDETKAESSAAAEINKEAETKESEVAKSGEEKESDKDGVKNDTKDVSKDDETVKKVNGTTQNGDTASTMSDDNDKKIHTNGVNEPCTSDSSDTKTNTDNLPQNREAESSTDASAESIKVKKVVDSTVADGAGEPDVVPPAAVVVAATS